MCYYFMWYKIKFPSHRSVMDVKIQKIKPFFFSLYQAVCFFLQQSWALGSTWFWNQYLEINQGSTSFLAFALDSTQMLDCCPNVWATNSTSWMNSQMTDSCLSPNNPEISRDFITLLLVSAM